MPTLVLFNKPYRVLSQFSPEKPPIASTKATLSTTASKPLPPKKETLADYISEKGVYPAGRLDYDSEGLLLLTDNGALQHHIAHPTNKQAKTYWVQVEGIENPIAIQQLRQGVDLKDGRTLPAHVESIAEPELWPRTPPVRFRQAIPTHWLSITISEGKNRQIRRMTAAVGLPTLRLVRASIGDWTLEHLQPGEYRLITVDAPPTTTHTRSSKKARHTKTNKNKTRQRRRTNKQRTPHTHKARTK